MVRSPWNILWIPVGFVAVFFLLVMFKNPEAIFKGSRRSQFHACFEQLSHVKMGIESYASENKDISGIDPYADAACHRILAGFEKSEECRGLVKDRVENACLDFKVTLAGTTTYNITGASKDRIPCQICVTESGAFPNNYDDCTLGNVPDCEKARDIRYNTRR